MTESQANQALSQRERRLLFWASFLSLTAAGVGFAFRVAKGGEYGAAFELEQAEATHHPPKVATIDSTVGPRVAEPLRPQGDAPRLGGRERGLLAHEAPRWAASAPTPGRRQ